MRPSISQRTNSSLITISFVLLSLSLLTKIVGTLWLRRYSQYFNSDFKEYSYIGDDYPEMWPVARPPVLMASDTSQRFRFNTSDGVAEWSAIVPGDGLIRLGALGRPYTISMLHQLRCLNILREEVAGNRVGDASPTALARHCLNYIKQMVMCRGDMQLESFRYATNEDPIDLLGEYECKDWGAVYDAVRENQKSHQRPQRGQEL